MVVNHLLQMSWVYLNNKTLSNIEIKTAFRESRLLFCDLIGLH